jgi:hypothetical protein
MGEEWATPTRAECTASDGGRHSRAGAFKTPHRRAYVLTAFESAHQRIEAAFPGGTDNARAELAAMFPDTLRDIDRAEQAALQAAGAYADGTTATPAAFMAAVAKWKRAVLDGFAALDNARSSALCIDCGAEVTTTIKTGLGQRVCTRCLREGATT